MNSAYVNERKKKLINSFLRVKQSAGENLREMSVNNEVTSRIAQ